MPIHILLIEDNPDHALITRSILKKAEPQYILDVAANAQEGLKKIYEGMYDLIITDYRLPDANGMDILQSMNTKQADVPLVVITSAGSEKIAVELMNQGAYDYIVKDASYNDTLPVVIRRTLDRFNANKEKMRLERELAESNKKLRTMYEIKSDFTSMVSHELRTPLNAISESISIVFDGSLGCLNEEQKKFLQITTSNVDRLNRLINDILDFSKLESKKMDYCIKEHNVVQVIRDIILIQKLSAEKKNLYLHGEFDDELMRIPCDADRITQVVTNLISNAVKFT
ncbi:MAG: hybrid sensor histidine kinase/response regulator, partial [bacterium]